jgi:hypothetical protein
MTPSVYVDRTEPQIENRLFTQAAREIARAELAETRRVLRTAVLADPVAAPKTLRLGR